MSEGGRCEPRDSEGEHFAFRDKMFCNGRIGMSGRPTECKAAHPVMPLTVTHVYLYTCTATPQAQVQLYGHL